MFEEAQGLCSISENLFGENFGGIVNAKEIYERHHTTMLIAAHSYFLFLSPNTNQLLDQAEQMNNKFSSLELEMDANERSPLYSSMIEILGDSLNLSLPFLKMDFDPKACRNFPNCLQSIIDTSTSGERNLSKIGKKFFGRNYCFIFDPEYILDGGSYKCIFTILTSFLGRAEYIENDLGSVYEEIREGIELFLRKYQFLDGLHLTDNFLDLNPVCFELVQFIEELDDLLNGYEFIRGLEIKNA